MERGVCLGIDPALESCEISVHGGGGAGRSTPVAVRAVLGLALLFYSSIVWAESLETTKRKRFCSSDGRVVSPWLAANPTIQLLPEDVSSVDRLVEHLRGEYSIPISWIQARPEEPLRMEAGPSQLDDLMRSVAEQYPDYRCEARSGRLILRSKAEIFDRVIEGVNVVDRDRFVALGAYIEHLQTLGGGFESWLRPLVGGILGSPLLTEKVTLAPRAPMLDHLVQLLGQRPNTYFTIPAPGDVPRTIWMSEIP